MDLFHQDFDSAAPLKSGAKWFGALVARVAVAFVNALSHTDVWKRLQMSAQQVWVFCLLLAGWVVLSIIPQTAAIANTVNAILFTIGAISLAQDVGEIASSLAQGLKTAYEAQSDKDLETAGERLAPALSEGVVLAIELFVTHKAFRIAEVGIVRRYPVPKWFEELWNKLLGKKRAQEPKAPEPPKKKPTAEENRKEPKAQESQTAKATEPRTDDPLKRPASRAVEMQGAHKAAQVADDLLPMAGLALGGLALVGGSLAALALSRRKR